jgi:hypothetical protein
MPDTKTKNFTYDAHFAELGSSFSRKSFIEYVEKVGSRRTLIMTITDDRGDTISMNDTSKYNSGKWKVWRSDGSLIINGDIVFFDRPTGVIQYSLTASDTLPQNAGVWAGEVEIFDDNGISTEQTETFTFIIRNSY